MITEDYVSFKIAELLKEKGFEEECVYFYDWDEEDEIYHICSNGGSCNSKEYPTYFSMPTLQMAMKWLREVYKLYVEVVPNPFNFEHQDVQDGWGCEVTHLSDLSYDSNYEFFQKKYSTYEEACEAAIKYCLENLIHVS